MMLRILPPAGSKIMTHTAGVETQHNLNWPGYNLHWLQSGTAALAYALLHKKAQHVNIAKPEVIIPGYCCPDLISAALFAGYTPVIVDIAENDPSYNLAELTSALSTNTLAVICINFMGIKERLAEIRSALSTCLQVSIIEDNAQWFPCSNNEANFSSDYVCFSFGRGKAVSLLGGGMVAVKASLPVVEIPVKSASSDSTRWRVKAKLINRLAHPNVYYWLSKLSFLKLGHTQYHELTELAGFPFENHAVFNVNLQAYQQRIALAEQVLDNCLGPVNGFKAMTSERRGRLLRYPVVCESAEQKETLIKALKPYGASKMYATALPLVDGVRTSMWHSESKLPNANSFASRFFTLPVHDSVQEKDLTAIANLIKKHS
ncbi:DegT/DnrJ/EryC1/StrS family aminotransferase [Reinekea sp.]|uniref:DegT/DnrJ/EryC1/StrS family aminotransferase n=1 Tax=Reinekea sp. TaxID=1970455 RepID=UPI003989FAFF